MQDWNETSVFKDKKDREIVISIDEDVPEIVAKHNGIKIGHIEFDDLDGYFMLSHAELKSDYQKAGIATQMLRELCEFFDDILIPNQSWSSSTGHKYYLSSEGAALVNACIKLGILRESMISSF